MPVTFFAHQVPVIVLARRWPVRLDGVALVVGSMAPDFAFALNGSRWSVWTHELPNAVLFCVPVTVAVAWVVVRVMAPVVPDHLPDLAPWHLRDYRGLAAHRFDWVSTPLSALIGAATHIAIDHLTHDWGWFAQNLSWYGETLFAGPFGVDVTVFRAAQYVGHVVGTAFCIGMLGRLGRQRWMAHQAAIVPRAQPTPTSTLVLIASTMTGLLVGLVWVAQASLGSATDIIRVSATTFAGVAVGSLAIARPAHVRTPQANDVVR